MKSRFWVQASLTCLTLAALPMSSAWAQASAAVSDEVIVTATKHGAQSVQDVPIAVTAFGAAQLEELNFKTLRSLSYTMPNVHLEDVGTSHGYANFSIRGLGLNSSIPTIDPTVGVFVDGVYMGISGGVVLDNFDLEGVEVLRGPQGVLFGRNVTGGAVVLRTTAPTDTFQGAARWAYQSGNNGIADLVISGPLTEGLSAKGAIYVNDGKGTFTNLADGKTFGAFRQTVERLAFKADPSADIDLTLRLEHGDADGDGPAAQNHALFSRDSFDFSINNRGFDKYSWNQATLEANWRVPFGNGTITNVAGWRQYKSSTNGDIDSTTFTGFHSRSFTDQDQVSNELRYAGDFGPVAVTTGLYYFQQNLLYIEQRTLVGQAFPFVGGGTGDFSTWGAFAAADWALTDQFKLNLGVRYTSEKKENDVSRIRPGGGNIDARTLTYIPTDVGLDPEWQDTSPRVGFQYTPSMDTQIYGFWARGFRSGGVNFRHTALASTPRPFDSEEQSSFELGLKQDFADGLARVNLAVFTNKIEGLQRELNVSDPVVGVTQTIVNAGDATISGAEAEARLRLSDNFTINAQAGYSNGEYDNVTVDLNGDGLINATDKTLKIPRLSPWTYGLSINHVLELGGSGELSSRVGWNHRDQAFYTDSNKGFLNAVDSIDANLTYRPANGPWSLSVYGTNLTDEVSYGGDTQLPDVAPFGGDGAGPRPPPTFSPLNVGRIIGVEVRAKF